MIFFTCSYIQSRGKDEGKGQEGARRYIEGLISTGRYSEGLRVIEGIKKGFGGLNGDGEGWGGICRYWKTGGSSKNKGYILRHV